MTPTEKNAALEALIQPLNTAKYEIDCLWGHIDSTLDSFRHDYGSLDLTPDFQRGHVWTAQQQTHFLENIFRGVVSSAGLLIQFNCPNWDNPAYQGELPRGMQCIDGLQRLTAIRHFMAGGITPFGLTLADLQGSRYSPQGALYRIKIAIHNFGSRADLLAHYLALNAGGTPHSADEIERVRSLLADAQPRH